MSFFLFAILLLGVEDEPVVAVNNATEAADLEVTSRRVSLLLLEHSTLATVLEKKV